MCYDDGVDAPRFIADKTVGRLAKWLRLLGFDCALQREDDIERLFEQARREARIILTKSTKLPAGVNAPARLLLTSSDSMVQLRQVIGEFHLPIDDNRMLTICLVCNVPVESITREQARGLVPPYVFATQETFSRCPSCGRIYWAGTHKARMSRRLQSLGQK